MATSSGSYQYTRSLFFAIWEGWGCLSRTVHKAPSFEAPERKYHLFQAPIQAIEKSFCTNNPNDALGMGPLITVSWDVSEKPSAAEIAEALKNIDFSDFSIAPQRANLWWPED
jgi:hypothetical protein